MYSVSIKINKKKNSRTKKIKIYLSFFLIFALYHARFCFEKFSNENILLVEKLSDYISLLNLNSWKSNIAYIIGCERYANYKLSILNFIV